MRKLTLAEIKRESGGTWFENVRSDTSTARIIGGLRRDRYIITYEFPEGHRYYNVWGVIHTDEGYRIDHLAQFGSLLVAKSEIANPDDRAPLHQLYHLRARKFNIKETNYDH